MFYYLSGRIEEKTKDFVILEKDGYGFKIFLCQKDISEIQEGSEIRLYTFFYEKENQFLKIYGFLKKIDLSLFEMLISISGIGPKAALSLIGLSSAEEIFSAISQGKSEFLSRISGIGKKRAQKIILELKDKIITNREKESPVFEENLEIIEALHSLGFPKSKVKDALNKIPSSAEGLENRLKEALKILSQKK